MGHYTVIFLFIIRRLTLSPSEWRRPFHNGQHISHIRSLESLLTIGWKNTTRRDISHRGYTLLVEREILLWAWCPCTPVTDVQEYPRMNPASSPVISGSHLGTGSSDRRINPMSSLRKSLKCGKGRGDSKLTIIYLAPFFIFIFQGDPPPFPLQTFSDFLMEKFNLLIRKARNLR